MSNKLVVFYSRAGGNYVNGQIKSLDIGNTEVAAGIIKELTGADIFKIQQLQPYSDDYNECISQAQKDQKRGARPGLQSYPDNLESYNVIYLGYPNYWGTMPMAVFTFLEHVNLRGKTIKPFCTHEGSGLGTSLKDIKRLCPDSTVKEGLAIRGASVSQAKPAIKNWI